jgi:hypothetical protein
MTCNGKAISKVMGVLWRFDAVEWRVKSCWVCISEESSAFYVWKVIGISVTWPICVGNLQPASVYTWVWCLRHITMLSLVPLEWFKIFTLCTHPLNKLTHKNKPFIFGLEQIEAHCRKPQRSTFQIPHPMCHWLFIDCSCHSHHWHILHCYRISPLSMQYW